MSSIPTTTGNLEPLNRSHYPAETVEIALVVLAVNGGNSVRASSQLAEQGIEVPEATLKTWRSRFYPNRYAKACTELAPQLEAAVVAQARESVIHAGHVEQTLLQRLHDEAEHLDRKELAGALRNVSTSKAINVDKFLALTGRPTVIHGDKTGEGILRELREIAPSLFIDSTAEEEPTLPAPEPTALDSATPETVPEAPATPPAAPLAARFIVS